MGPRPARTGASSLPDFDLLVFVSGPGQAARLGSMVDAVIVDWEWQGKHERQRGADTQITRGTVDDLCQVRAATSSYVICRINGPGDSTRQEVEAAVSAGADEIIVPMVASAEQVGHVFELVDGRCAVGVMLETPSAVASASSFASLPLARAYVGLNDLAIARGEASIFTALVDGTVDGLDAQVGAPLGLGGVTLPGRGAPIPVRLLAAEIVRQGCSFTFLRRSFWRDLGTRAPATPVRRIREMIEELQARGPAAVAADRAHFVDAVRQIEGAS